MESSNPLVFCLRTALYLILITHVHVRNFSPDKA
jgi:hypothetical protein